MFGGGVQAVQAAPSSVAATTILSGNGRDAPKIEVVMFIVTNVDASARTFTLYHDVDGGASPTYDRTTALWWQKSVPAGESFIWQSQHPSGGIPVGAAGRIGIEISAADTLTCTIYAVTSKVQSDRVDTDG